MRVREEIKRAGHFWLPATPDKQVHGTLFVSDGGDIRLETLGVFEEHAPFSLAGMKLDRVVGKVEKDSFVTLDDCFYTRRQHGSAGVSKSLVRASRACFGAAYDSDEDMLLNSFQFSVEGIDEWIGKSGIEVNYDHANRSTTITQQPLDDIVFSLKDGIELRIVFASAPPAMPATTEARVSQKAYFSLFSDTGCHLDDFIRLAHRLATFLCLTVGQTLSIEGVTAKAKHLVPTTGEQTRPISLAIYYPSLPHSDEPPKVNLYDMLFRFPQIESDAERIFNNWFAAYDELGPAIRLYFSATTARHAFLTSRFLLLAQGLETYQRRTSSATRIKESDFNSLVDSLYEQCPERHREWLAERLQHGNEINLRARIKSLIAPFKYAFGNNRARERLVDKFVITRNYLTHYNPLLKERAAAGKDLLELCDCTELIFQLHLLQIAGFATDEIKSMFESSGQLQQKVRGWS